MSEIQQLQEQTIVKFIVVHTLWPFFSYGVIQVKLFMCTCLVSPAVRNKSFHRADHRCRSGLHQFSKLHKIKFVIELLTSFLMISDQ